MTPLAEALAAVVHPAPGDRSVLGVADLLLLALTGVGLAVTALGGYLTVRLRRTARTPGDHAVGPLFLLLGLALAGAGLTLLLG